MYLVNLRLKEVKKNVSEISTFYDITPVKYRNVIFMIHVFLSPPGVPPYTGISPFNCRACSSTSCTTSIQLTDQNGCVHL